MSCLSGELKDQLKKSGLRQIDFTNRAGLQVSTVSRIFNGVTLHPDDKDLDAIIKLLAKTPQDRAKLVRARLRDAYHGDFADYVKVTLNARENASKGDRLWLSEISVDPDVESAFKFLYSLVPSNPAVGTLIINLVKSLRELRGVQKVSGPPEQGCPSSGASGD